MADTAETLPASPHDLATRYVAVWNEPDPDTRRSLIRDLWAPSGGQVLEAPQGLRDTARSIGFDAPTLEARGYAALEVRVARAHEEFVGTGQFTFRARGDAARLGDVVKFRWEMVPVGGRDVAGVGLDVFLLDDEDRIQEDYQFIES